MLDRSDPSSTHWWARLGRLALFRCSSHPCHAAAARATLATCFIYLRCHGGGAQPIDLAISLSLSSEKRDMMVSACDKRDKFNFKFGTGQRDILSYACGGWCFSKFINKCVTTWILLLMISGSWVFALAIDIQYMSLYFLSHTLLRN